jgi:hypothetical protein
MAPMSETPKLTALIRLEEQPDLVDQIKRIVLFFDRVEYLLPECSPIITETLIPGRRLEDTSFAKKFPNGSIDISQFNYFRDAAKPFAFTLHSFDTEVQDTILAFEEAGIMSHHYSKGGSSDKTHDQFVRIRDNLAFLDGHDKEFMRLSETKPENYNLLSLFREIKYVTMSSDENPSQSFTFATFKEPRANHGLVTTQPNAS